MNLKVIPTFTVTNRSPDMLDVTELGIMPPAFRISVTRSTIIPWLSGGVVTIAILHPSRAA